jgi:hypothetical protein
MHHRCFDDIRHYHSYSTCCWDACGRERVGKQRALVGLVDCAASVMLLPLLRCCCCLQKLQAAVFDDLLVAVQQPDRYAACRQRVANSKASATVKQRWPELPRMPARSLIKHWMSDAVHMQLQRLV